MEKPFKPASSHLLSHLHTNIIGYKRQINFENFSDIYYNTFRYKQDFLATDFTDYSD